MTRSIAWERVTEADVVRAMEAYDRLGAARFFEAHGWREAEFRSMWDESLRLKRSMPLARFWNVIGKLYPKSKREEFRRMSGIVLLERT